MGLERSTWGVVGHHRVETGRMDKVRMGGNVVYLHVITEVSYFHEREARGSAC